MDCAVFCYAGNIVFVRNGERVMGKEAGERKGRCLSRPFPQQKGDAFLRGVSWAATMLLELLAVDFCLVAFGNLWFQFCRLVLQFL